MAVSTKDPTQPIRVVAQIAMISEAQSPPTTAVLAAPTLDALQPLEPVKPSPSVASPAERPMAPGQSSSKIPMRIRRLLVDAEQMSRAFSGGAGPVRIKSFVGDPPEIYQIEYRVKGLQKGWLGKPKPRTEHLVEIQLTSEYPRVSPICKMLTPVFHPNIDETTICVGDHWTAGARLVDLVIQIAEMLAYQAYNIKSPLNGEAAMWADLNGVKLPTDSQNLHPGEP
ncbi:MAG TPA: ubiquitin-conjugating enzyme E2 [Tepidisphaeraceae bacterium]|nr:ubiquitin-conjugating enzyme E2 [Tepidisphaeraceae bacterium]